jgi:hypothetical protein
MVCYATGNIRGNSWVGGIVGKNSWEVYYCYALNSTVRGSSFISRIGWNNDSMAGNAAFVGMGTGSDAEFTFGSGSNHSNGEDVSITWINGNSTLGGNFNAIGGWTTRNGFLPGLFGQLVEMPEWLLPGSANNPIHVSNEVYLRKVGRGNDNPIGFRHWTLSAHYKLTADITLTSNWIAIGTSTNPFRGNFNGNGHVIYNMTIVNDFENQGMFGYLTGTVQNLGLVNVDIRVRERNVGGIAGITFSGRVYHCYVTGVVSGLNNVGGIVGSKNIGIVSNSYTTCDVIGTNSIGGIVGYNNGVVTACYATGNIRGNSRVGGIVGSNVYSVRNCYALNSVIRSNSSVSRIGWNTHIMTGNSAFDGMRTDGGAAFTPGSGATHSNGEDVNAAWINSDGTFDGLFTSTRGWTTRNGFLPGLFGQLVEMPEWLLSGSANNPILVSNEVYLRKVGRGSDNPIGFRHWTLSAHYKLIADITLTSDWTPIGTSTNPFSGTFIGNGHVISNMTIQSNSNDQGMFGYLTGTVYGFGLRDVNIRGQQNVGGIAGSSSNGNIFSCYVTGHIRGTDNVGGLVGSKNSGSISNSYTTCEITATGNNIGGIVGNNNGSIYVCYATGIIRGNSRVGGIVGNNNHRVLFCYALNLLIRGNSDVSRIGWNNHIMTGNGAFDGMRTGMLGFPFTPVSGATHSNGECVSAVWINNDGSLGRVFTPRDEWTIRNGFLPGLFGQLVPMPEWLRVGCQQNCGGNCR